MERHREISNHNTSKSSSNSLHRPPFFQAKLTVNQPNDAYEQEADAVADKVMRMPASESEKPFFSASETTPKVQRKCAECEAEEKKVQRKTLSESITPILQMKGVGGSDVSEMASSKIASSKGGGNTMDANTNSFMSNRFGNDFSGVKIHNDGEAVQLSRELNARAFTVGNDIYFNQGEYQPNTDSGKHLLAHELTHTVQQGGGVHKKSTNNFANANSFQNNIIQKKDGDKSKSSCTAVKILLPNALVLYGSEGTLVVPIETNITPGEGTITYNKTSHNFILPTQDKGKVFFNYSVSAKDVALFNAYTESISTGAVPLTIKNSPDAAKLTADGSSNLVPRPTSLPVDGDYKLAPITDAPSSWVDSLPEDKIVKVVSPGTSVPASNPISPYSFNPFPGVGAGLTVGLNSTLSTFGFSPVPGGNGIGLIGFPRAFSSLQAIPQSASTWGHTEVYLRIDGKIVGIRGYTVESFMDALRNMKSVPAGKAGIPATISSTPEMFFNTASKTIEYPVNEATARALLERLPKEGAPPATGHVEYTGRPSVLGRGSNCVTWACAQMEEALGGKVGTRNMGPLAEPVNAGEGLQGRFMKAAKANPSEFLPVAEATGEAVVSSMPRYIQVLKWGGRAFIVIGAGLTIYEIVKAPEEQKTRTAVGAVSGFAGGLAAGAAAGLLCGPGALACSLVLGLGFGIAGAFASRSVAEGIYDEVTNPDREKMGPRINVAPDGTWHDDKGRFHMGPGPKW